MQHPSMQQSHKSEALRRVMAAVLCTARKCAPVCRCVYNFLYRYISLSLCVCACQLLQTENNSQSGGLRQRATELNKSIQFLYTLQGHR